MSERIWYYALDNAEQGPIGEADLAALVAQGRIGPKTLVWTDGMADWQEAASALPSHMRSPAWGGAPQASPPQPPAMGTGAAASVPAQSWDPGASGAGWQAAGAHPTGFAESVKACFTRYATFSGRARRPEFWWFALFSFLANIVVTVVEFAIFGYYGDFSPLSTLFSLAMIIPSFAVGARRLHDTGRSGWWQLIVLIPLVGWIILIIWLATRGEEGPNAYGPA